MNGSQDKTANGYKALVTMVTQENKDYQKALTSLQKVKDGVGSDSFKRLLNFQDGTGFTLIHHIVANPANGVRPGIWALIELKIKDADFTLADNLGNTGLHTCVNTYIPYMKAQVSSKGLTVFASDMSIGLIPVKSGNRPADEQVMFACMADVGALLWCGADPKAINQKGEDVFSLMNSVALLLKPGSAKPNICEASCKQAFLTFFSQKKTWFQDTKFNKNMYPWAPNVVTWVESLEVDATVQNASLTATATPQSGGCTLF